MNGTLVILSGLFAFALVVRLMSYIVKSQQQVRALRNEIDGSTQALFESRRKTEWLESHLEDLLVAAQRRSEDLSVEWQRIDQVASAIRNEARRRGYRIGLGDVDQTDWT
jgi:hypothetical protein